MSNIFFTSDFHFNHYKSIIFGNRPFKTVEEMNEGLINNFNNVVTPRDTCYILGDFGFGNLEELRKIRYRLRGKLHIILGNHDFKNKLHRCGCWFSSMSDLKTIKINKQKIVLCHYAMRVWDCSHYNSWMLYAHSHGKLKGQGKSFDVGVDCHGYKPISYDQVVEIMKTLPDNFNLIKKKEE
jgi:calcineurin-like phosphoesterase family protein